jgi:hypothetical protein
VRYSWSNAAREAAQTYGVVSATLDTVRPLAAKNDVRLDVFTRALQSLTSAQRTQILNQEKAGTDALVAALAIQGMPVIGEKQGSSIGVLAVLTLFEESQKARFIAS